MPNLNRLLFISLIILVFSCHKKEEITSPLIYELKIKADYPLTVELYYKGTDERKFTNKKKLIKEIKNVNTWETISFKPDTKDFNGQLRFVFGHKPQVKRIEIGEFSIRSNHKTIVLEKEDYNLFFIPNEYLITDNHIQYKTQMVNNKFSPYILTTPFFHQRLKIEF